MSFGTAFGVFGGVFVRPKDRLALFHFGRLPYCSGALGVGVPAHPIGRASNERPLYAQCLFSRELLGMGTTKLISSPVGNLVATGYSPVLRPPLRDV